MNLNVKVWEEKDKYNDTPDTHANIKWDSKSKKAIKQIVDELGINDSVEFEMEDYFLNQIDSIKDLKKSKHSMEFA